jgi:cephalosporin-C deacetylase-like acetyl esterase
MRKIYWLTSGLFCFGLVALAQPAPADDEWTVAPGGRTLVLGSVEPNSLALVKSLGDAAEYVLRWKPPADAASWGRRRPEVERAFRQALGLDRLPERSPLHSRVLAQHDRGDYLVENVVFESRPGFPVTANVYRPKATAGTKRAAILCPIGHYLSAGKTHPDVQARCIKLARMGFVVLVYDAIGQGERMRPGNIHHDAGYALLPLGQTIAGWMVWDSMRAIDYLLTRDDVDATRIGMTGNSGGGLNTLFTAALDHRVAAAAVVGFTFEFNNWLKYGGAHCTCTHLPGLFRGMEWFEIAGLIAPRALMMLQGDRDAIFPIGGARRAGHNAETVYRLLGQPEKGRFVELQGQPHAYSRPYREQVYGWMAQQLLGQGKGEPVAEGDVRPLAEKAPELLCDPGGAFVPRAPAVVDLAREEAMKLAAALPFEVSGRRREAAAQWVRELTAPPESRPHYLAPRTHKKSAIAGGSREKISFVSEDGEYIPGLLWLPERGASPQSTVIIVDSRGKAAVAESGLVQPLVAAGVAVLVVDLRGRGETLGRIQPGYDTNFRLIANQILLGQPLPGRRAFDLMRALDYLAERTQLPPDGVTVVGLGDDGLPALVAAAADRRIHRVAVAGYFHSFVSGMRERTTWDREHASDWNDPQVTGGVDTGDYRVDFGSAIPAVLRIAGMDVPDIAALIAPRKVLFCQVPDSQSAGAAALVARFRQVTAAAGKSWMRYAPGRQMDAKLLLEWIADR